MSGLIEKIEHAMHHGKKAADAKTDPDSDIPKFGSGHLERPSTRAPSGARRMRVGRGRQRGGR